MKQNPSAEVFLLNHIHWQIFGTLTFKGGTQNTQRHITRFKAIMRRIAKESHIHFSRLPYALRREHGGRFGRQHFHFLLSGLPEAKLTEICDCIAFYWQGLGGGTTEVAVYDRVLGGMAYFTKHSAEQGNDGRESAQFGPRHCELMLSPGAQKILAAKAKKLSVHH